MKTLPNFLVIGAAKSGTTSLYQYLREHPQIYMSPVKEPEFFSYMGEKIDRRDPRLAPAIFAITEWKDYEALFKNVRNETAVGEASPGYIYSPEAPKRIKQFLPQAKLIAVLRNPVARAYSHFTMRLNKSSDIVVEPVRDFEEVLKAEESRIRDGWLAGWHYKRRGFYYEQLKRYFDLFDRSQIQIYLYEDLEENTLKVVRGLYQFLGVEDRFVPVLERVHNQGKYEAAVKNDAWRDFLTGENRLKGVLKQLVPTKYRTDLKKYLLEKNMTFTDKPTRSGPTPELKEKLLAEYRPDILKLQELIHRDLSAWLR